MKTSLIEYKNNQRCSSQLIKGKALEFTGKLFSEEHRKWFTAEKVIAKVVIDDTDKNKLNLTINYKKVGEWFREKFEENSLLKNKRIKM